MESLVDRRRMKRDLCNSNWLWMNLEGWVCMDYSDGQLVVD